MARVLNKLGQSFSIAGMSVKTRAGTPVGAIQVAGELALDGVVAEAITTRGGFAQLPVAARRGAQSGEFKISCNECPPWMKAMALGGSLAPVTAGGSGGYVSTATRVSGADDDLDAINSKLEALATAKAGEYFFEINTAAGVDVIAHTEAGVFEQTIPASALTGAVVIADTGVTLNNLGALTGTDAQVVVSVKPAWKSRETVTFGNADAANEYALVAWTVARRGESDAAVEIRLNRVMFYGLVPKWTDNASVQGVEISGQMLATDDGRPWSVDYSEV